MRVKCPDCRETIELSVNDYEEGDSMECPECALGLIIKVREGRFKLVSDKAKYYDEELDAFFESDE